jgi:membrane protein YdbS with pleckstrin-like domain
MKLTTDLHLVPRPMRGAIPPLPQYVFMAWCLVRHRYKFTFNYEETLIQFTSEFFLSLYVRFIKRVQFVDISDGPFLIQKTSKI